LERKLLRELSFLFAVVISGILLEDKFWCSNC
uniref:Ovule protein n=1 Tax=Brugia timori TaxID=42155 RepID=A0A0R3QE00_9BILA